MKLFETISLITKALEIKPNFYNKKYDIVSILSSFADNYYFI